MTKEPVEGHMAYIGAAAILKDGDGGPASIQVFIQELTADVKDIEEFYHVSFSTLRLERLCQYLSMRQEELYSRFNFDHLSQEEQVDWVLARTFVARKLRQTRADLSQVKDIAPFLRPWSIALIELLAQRQAVHEVDGKEAGAHMSSASVALDALQRCILAGDMDLTNPKRKSVALRAAQAMQELHDCLQELVEFFRGYEPVLTWWLHQPWGRLDKSLTDTANSIHTVISPGESGDDIIGQPLGRDALLQELQEEFIPYTPEELVEIGETELKWCETQLALAAAGLCYSDSKAAMERVRNTFVAPGQQIYAVKDFAEEAIAYITAHDMITVPQVAKECWQTKMMTPERQKINPFFTGGDEITVSYPTSDMAHQDKLMSMRGNNPPFSRCTVHHELVPGHHLQFYYMSRYRPYRKLFDTSFWMEGWALYWEFILWDRGFPSETSQKWATNEFENRVGMLFWRAHRCARIIFSVQFHLGKMTARQCIDLLVDRVGHERATAEGEVRRSFAGEYTPLYQAGYMLGALQLYELRRELVDSLNGPMWTEKQFHDRVMKENTMPIELLRALLKREKLTTDRESRWRFYKFRDA